jgi:hypothetical protein
MIDSLIETIDKNKKQALEFKDNYQNQLQEKTKFYE